MALEKRKQIVELDPLAPDGVTMLVGQKPGAPAGQFPSSDVTDPIVAAFNSVIWKLSRDWSGELVTSGAGNAFEITSAREPLTLDDGFAVAFRADRVNSAASTLKVSAGTDAKALTKYNGAPLASGDIVADGIYRAVYVATADEFRILTIPLSQYAKLASPAFSGTATAPTASAGTNNGQLATTAFVQLTVAALVASAPATLDTLNELAEALGNDANFATTVANNLALKAPLASPTFTGAPTAPTPTLGDNSTKIATTAFVQAALAAFGLTISTGSFTPVYKGKTTAGATTHTTQTGTYYRIGNLVYVEIRIAWSAATGTGQAAIGGLPASAAGIAPLSLYHDSYAFGSGKVGSATIVGSDVNLYVLDPAGGVATSAAIDAAGDLRMAGVYLAVP